MPDFSGSLGEPPLHLGHKCHLTPHLLREIILPSFQFNYIHINLLEVITYPCLYFKMGFARPLFPVIAYLSHYTSLSNLDLIIQQWKVAVNLSQLKRCLTWQKLWNDGHMVWPITITTLYAGDKSTTQRGFISQWKTPTNTVVQYTADYTR